MMLLVTRGMDTVFRILIDGDTAELNLLEEWGKSTKKQVETWVKRLKGTFGDKFDRENLKLSAFAVRNSLGPNLLARVVKLVGATASGPEIFIAAVFQVNYMTAYMVRGVCNKIVALKLKEIPGENVAKLSEMIGDYVKEIESSGSIPQDLLFLVTKPYMTGTSKAFETYAQGIYTKVVANEYNEGYNEIIHKMNDFYQALVQNDDYEPAKGGKKDQDATVLQGMIAKLESKLDKLQVRGANSSSGHQEEKRKCYGCGQYGHIKPNCPNKNNNNNGNGNNQNSNNNNNNGKREFKPIVEWHKKKPGQGESHIMTKDGQEYKWCDKCLKGQGLWTVGPNRHVTSDHKTWKQCKAEAKGNETGKLAVLPTGPLEVNFVYRRHMLRVCIC